MVRRVMTLMLILYVVPLVRPSAQVQAASTFTVTSIADPGDGACDSDCTLREALTSANANPNSTIAFSISGSGVHTIQPTSSLPILTAPVIINGTTQPGYISAPLIEIDGSLITADFTNGLALQGGSSTVKGVIINGFTFGGITMVTGGGNTIVGNYIGTDSTGTSARGNRDGIYILNSSNNVIGGTTPADRNIISGNNDDGIDFANLGAGPFSLNNSVWGNYIGTDVTGTQPLGNAGDGIKISERSSDNLIGGTTAGIANVIAFNNGRGVYAENVTTFATGNRILGNSIFSNGGLGIDLIGDGVTVNDAGDADTGPNNLQNFPVVMGASPLSDSIALSGTLNSLANTSFRLEFFVSPTCDSSSHGEGKTYLGFTNVTTDSLGNASFAVNLSGTLATPDVITATATDSANNTSEFSQCALVENPPSPDPNQSPPRNVFNTVTPTLTWKGVIGAVSYEVQVDNNANFSSTEYESVVTTRFVTTTPLAEGPYYWRVRGKNANGIAGQWSVADSFVVDIP